MRILFVHRNFPGQFRYLAPAMAKRGHDVLALGGPETVGRNPGVRLLAYKYDLPDPDQKTFGLAQNYALHTQRGEVVARAAAGIRLRDSYVPDVICGHLGFGDTLFLKEIWPEARLLLYAEFFYRPHGLDTDFDPEFHTPSTVADIRIRSRTGPLLLALQSADQLLSPTEWQASTFPTAYRDRIATIHDGVDTALVAPDADAAVQFVAGGPTFKAGDEVLTFVNRNLEPYRGYHILMRALPAVLAARPNAHVVLVGGDGTSYGPRPANGKKWKDIFLNEVRGGLDLSRVHFVGKVPYEKFLDLIRISRVHAYLTYPFVLSWSMLEAMSCGALIVGSRTPPVTEVITDGKNGVLVDFFDVAGWSRALIEALAEPARFSSLRQAARRTIVERYDLQTVSLPKLIAMIEGGAKDCRAGQAPR